MTAPTKARLVTGTSLIDGALFDRLEGRIAADHPDLAPDMPARIVDQALAFLGACAVTTEPIGPSEIVDIGWHTFILYTLEYATFCQRIAGRFIHHVPDDVPAAEPPADGPGLTATVQAITDAGYRVDPDLWGCAAKCNKCNQCHQGCTDSPKR